METYKDEIIVAMSLLLCLFFKLDVIVEYGFGASSYLTIATCILLALILLGMTLWLLFTNCSKLWAITKGVIVSDLFDFLTWFPILLPMFCIERYKVYFACTSWILGDLMLVGMFLYFHKYRSLKQETI